MGMEGDWTPSAPSGPPTASGFAGGPPQQNYGSTGQSMVPGMMNQGLQGPRGPPFGNNSVPFGPPGQSMAPPGTNPGLQGPSRAPMGNSGPPGVPGGFRPPGQAVPPSANQQLPVGGPRVNSNGPPQGAQTQHFSGQPAFRPPFASGPPNAGPPGVVPNAGPPGVWPTFANSSASVAGAAPPGQGRGVFPDPSTFGPPQQQQAGGLGGPPPSISTARGLQQQPGPFSAPPPSNAAFRGPPVGGPAAGPPPVASGSLNYSQAAATQPTPAGTTPQFPGAQAAARPYPPSGPIPTSAGFPGPIGGPPRGPPPSQFGGQSSARGSVPAYGPENVPLSDQLQSLNPAQQMQGGFSGPPRQAGTNAGVLPPWQQAGQGGPQGPPRRIYPDPLGAPPTGAQPPQGPGVPQQYGHPPSHLPPSMGHHPGVVEKYAPGIAGMAQPSSPAPPNPQSGTSRIDPNQIPRPLPGPTSIDFETRCNGQANLPPSATANFIVKDTGNCSPRLMRSTLNQIPCSGDLLGTSGMPLALMVQPFAMPHPSDDPIQIVDFGESGPVRCSRCKAYINPFMKFLDQGRRFTCNLCGFTNETPRDYHCNLGPDGRRRDADQRPELSKGAVEFVASKEYLVRDPMPPVYYFLIDVSSTAVQTGAVAAACSAINRALADLPEGPRTMVGIATFDTTIHYYSINKNLQQAAMLVVPDIQDPYTPLQSDLIVPLSEVREQVEQLLESIPSMFQNNRIPEAAFGAAVKGAFLAMKSTGGKLLVFQSVLPSVGVGALTPRQSAGRLGGEKEYLKLLQPSDKILKTMAIEFAEFQVCVELFVMSLDYVDIMSLAVVPRTTGGQVYYYHPFSAVADSAKLYNDLRWNVTRPQGLEAVMRVRCSEGLQVQEYYGNFCKRIPTDVDLPAIDCDKTIMVTFKHDDKFQDGAECCFQCALLYTTLTGERRIRVITLSLSCTTVLSNLFRGADLDAQFTYLLKHAAHEVPSLPLSQVRDQITSQCVNILYTYRKFCATASSSGQLILPEALKLLPLYTLALIKSVGLRMDARSDTHVDERTYWITRVASLPASLSIPAVYPRMFGIHNLPSKEELGGGILPPVVPLSSENLDQDGIFLLETGEDAYLYVGKQAGVEFVQQLFGVNSVDEVVSDQFVLPVYDNEPSKRLNEIINEIRQQRSSYLRLRLLRRGDPLEFLFFSFLVEDKSSSGLSYVEFLVHVHRQIQNKMT
ncbi:unnamed protein product [Calypogeia fissa]